MRVALIHDWLTGMRGGERVLEELCKLFPDATLFTLFHDPGSVTSRIESMAIRTSPLNRIPGARRYYRYLLPLYPWAVSGFDLGDYDLVLSNSHAAAKGIRRPPGSVHVCYCLTPMRYIWDMQADYFNYADRLLLRRMALRALTLPLRAWDRATARGVDYFIADSHHVQKRIARYYQRTAEVIYPPVDTKFFCPSNSGSGGNFYLIVSALVPYKRLDLAVDAFDTLGRPLVIVGSGPDLKTLEKRAAGNIEFRGFVSNRELRDLYRGCRSLVIPGREDFGLASLEAQACGRPIVAYGAGGSLESISDGETGILFRQQSVADLIQAVRRLDHTTFDPAKLRANAERFSADRFRQSIIEAVEKARGSAICSAHPLRGEAPESAAQIHPSLTGVFGRAKRSLDICLSTVGLAAFGLLILVCALLIRLGSPGPAFFFQRRVGLRGRIFNLIKLRTMKHDAEEVTGPTWAVKDDDRCTPLGGFLRRYGIDELPQLWNVLRGDMSLVGPRPERPEFYRILEEAIPGFSRRLEVHAGLTGLAQIRGWRGDTSLEERLQSDLEYIERWSFWKDIAILFRTPFSLHLPRYLPAVQTPEIKESFSDDNAAG